MAETYIVRRARDLGGEPADLAPPRRRDRRGRRPAPRPPSARVDRRRRPRRAARARRPAHAPARARPRGRRDGRDRLARRRRRRLHRRVRDGQHRPRSPTPPASSSRCWRLGRAAGLRRRRSRSAPSPWGWRASGSPSSARWPTRAARVRVFSDDGTACATRHHAPRARVREGVRRRDRPARAGAAPHRGRADERGRGLRRARPRRLAGGRRGVDHRPRRAARRARRRRGCTCATCRTAGSVEIIRWAKTRGIDVTAEVTPHHLLLTDELAARLRPASSRSTRRCAATRTCARCARPSPTARSTSSPPTTRRTPAEDKECEWADAAIGMVGLETALARRRIEAMVETGAARLGRRRRRACRGARARSAGSPATAARSPRASPPTSCSSTPTRECVVEPLRAAQPEPQHALRRHHAAGRRWSPRSCAAARRCSTGPCGPRKTEVVGS